MDDAEALDALKRRARTQIRARLRSLRAAYPEAGLNERSARIVERVRSLDEYQRAHSIALFFPLSHEVDLRPLDRAARAAKKTLYYPVMDPASGTYRTGFAAVGGLSELGPRGRPFPEPGPEAPRAAQGDIDLVLVPALAVSADGHRLGYGSGFYDSVLPDFRPPGVAVVVAFDFQLLAELPTLEWDVGADWVVTDARALRSQSVV